MMRVGRDGLRGANGRAATRRREPATSCGDVGSVRDADVVDVDRDDDLAAPAFDHRAMSAAGLQYGSRSIDQSA
jgi:hypothetical protein